MARSILAAADHPEYVRAAMAEPIGIPVDSEVVLMSVAGRFRVVARDGAVLTIEDPDGVRRVVLDTAVRVVPPAPDEGAVA